MDEHILHYEYQPIKTEGINDYNLINKKFAGFNKCGFGVLHVNIRSVSKNLDELKIYLSQFCFEFDCIILTETWVMDDLDFFCIDGYNHIYNNGNFNQNDGVIVYMKGDLNFTYRKVYLGETCALEIHVNFCNKNINILGIYRSPPINLDQFLTELLKYFQTDYTRNTDIGLIAGDINIDILKRNDITERYLNIMAEYGYESFINGVTRVAGRSCNDHFFVNCKHTDIEIDSCIYQVNITDHYPICLKFELKDKNDFVPHNNTVIYTDYKKLKNEIKEINWDEFYRYKSINRAAEFLISKIELSLGNCSAKVKKKHTEIKRSNWITNGLVKSINEKDKMYRMLKADQDNENLKAKFKRYRNRLTDLIKKTKINYFKKQIENNQNSTKNMWNTINSACGKVKKELIIKEIKEENGNTISDKREIVERFNSFFSGIGEKLAGQIVQPQNPFVENKISSNSIFISPTTSEEVERVVLDLKNKKSAGIDKIKSEVLKEIVLDIKKPLAHLINTAIEDGVWPDPFKTAIVKPIYKSGDKTNVSNYRPISLLTSLNKVFETIIKDRVNKYLNKYKIISEHQFGFREGRSTQDAVALLVHEIFKNVNEGKAAACVFLDLAKAFDTVSHHKLLNDLEKIGFRGTSLKLLKSYLVGRKQMVEIDGVRSECREVKCGVPQGTVLGPILFIIYINSLLGLSSRGRIISFADDTVIFYSDDSWHNLREKIESDFMNIKTFFDSKLLTLNYDKTKYIAFSINKSNRPHFKRVTVPSHHGSFDIQETDHIKYLGVYIDEHLRWNKHILSITKTLRSIIYRFKFLKGILAEKSLRAVYSSLVESRLRYGIIAWGASTDNYLKQLNVVQKLFLKVLLARTRLYPSNSLYRECEIFDIRQLYFEIATIWQYKNKSSLNPINHSYQTRDSTMNRFKTPASAKSFGQRCFTFLAPRFFNFLPVSVRNCMSMRTFKMNLKLFLKQTPREEIDRLVEFRIVR